MEIANCVRTCTCAVLQFYHVYYLGVLDSTKRTRQVKVYRQRELFREAGHKLSMTKLPAAAG